MNVMKRVGLAMAFVLVAAMFAGPAAQAATTPPPPAMRLPFAQGLTAITSGPHTWDGTDDGPRGSVDFGSPDGSEQLVYAAAGGRAWVYNDLGWSRCYVVVDHGNGWMTAYYHLKNVPADLNGKTIASGAVVGNMGAIGVDTCGGGTVGYRHVHFVLLRNGSETAINGLSIGGYTIHEAPGAYCGTWTRNSDGSTVASSLTLDPPSTTWPQGRCPRMEPGLTNSEAAPAVLSPTPTPTISGTAAVGQTLTAVPGTWGPAPVTLTYQWYRGSTAISGATATTYQVQTADVGSTLKVSVTGSKDGYPSVTMTSANTATVAGLTLSPTPTPTISGTAAVGQTLTAVPGTWGPAPVTLTYQWYRGSTAISGATATTYQVQTADVGSTLKVSVTGSKDGYPSVTKTSANTATVAGLTLSPTPTPTISGTARVGRTLTAVPGTWGPAPVTLTYQWYRGSSAISGATSQTYVIKSGDRGYRLKVVVTGSKPGYTTVKKTSASTSTVKR
jgi:murein DD-endopeptidase MepM/ murein hydrolase activator NlpD